MTRQTGPNEPTQRVQDHKIYLSKAFQMVASTT